MSKDLFLAMREHEINTENFLPNKKEVKKSAEQLAAKIIDGGEFNLKEVHAQLLRHKEAINILEAKIRKELPQENDEYFGIKVTFVKGGNILNYSEDEIYNALKKDLDNRVELLKLAQKQDVIDASGNDVPKVSITPIKSSLKATY